MSATRFPCPCCGYPTLAQEPPGTFQICPVCFWEDDSVQFAEPSYRGGANEPSLDEARASFDACGACDPASVGAVRPPTDEEKRNRVSYRSVRIELRR